MAVNARCYSHCLWLVLLMLMLIGVGEDTAYQEDMIEQGPSMIDIGSLRLLGECYFDHPFCC